MYSEATLHGFDPYSLLELHSHDHEFDHDRWSSIVLGGPGEKRRSLKRHKVLGQGPDSSDVDGCLNGSKEENSRFGRPTHKPFNISTYIGSTHSQGNHFRFTADSENKFWPEFRVVVE